jgi:hypothetical protein
MVFEKKFIAVYCDNSALGLESGAIKDAQMNASSQYNISNAAYNGRLHYTGGPSWCASTSDSSPYLQIDLGSPHIICAVATQGNYLENQWTKTYRMKGSTDGLSFTFYREGGVIKVRDIVLQLKPVSGGHVQRSLKAGAVSCVTCLAIISCSRNCLVFHTKKIFRNFVAALPISTSRIDCGNDCETLPSVTSSDRATATHLFYRATKLQDKLQKTLP